MEEPPFSLAFVMVKESFAGPAILFYLASDANKNKGQDHLKVLMRLTNTKITIREDNPMQWMA
jgi:hypothetical protein